MDKSETPIPFHGFGKWQLGETLIKSGIDYQLCSLACRFSALRWRSSALRRWTRQTPLAYMHPGLGCVTLWRRLLSYLGRHTPVGAWLKHVTLGTHWPASWGCTLPSLCQKAASRVSCDKFTQQWLCQFFWHWTHKVSCNKKQSQVIKGKIRS